MKVLTKRTDGGPDSNVTGYWLVEIKSLFSIALLRFSKGSREAMHSHAFWSISWLFKGKLLERRMHGFADYRSRLFLPSWIPIIVTRDNLHQVYGEADASWVLTFRGPWAKTWLERLPGGQIITLTNGRKRVG